MMPLLALLLAAAPATATDSTRWQAGLSYELQHHSRERTDWRWLQVTAGYRVAATTVLVSLARSTRFDRNEAVIAAEAYSKIGATAVSGRLQVTPDATVLPGSDLSVELERQVSRGWTVAGAYRRMGFATGVIDILSTAGTRYFFRGFAQLRLAVIPEGGRTGVSARAVLRRYFGATNSDWIEGFGAVGREVVLLGTGLPVAVRTVGALGLRSRCYFGPRWGLSLGFGWTGEVDLPSRVVGTAGLTLRW